jgi:hypothetical protein
VCADGGVDPPSVIADLGELTMTRGFDSIRGRRFARLGVLLVPAMLVVAACGASATPSPSPADAYQVVSQAIQAPMDQIKVQVGVHSTGGSSDISIDPSDIQIVLDTKAGKANVHLALPVSALGAEATQLQALGVTGDTLDLDVIYDGSALYAKSPLAATLIPMLTVQSGTPVTGDLTGWLRLGTAEDFAGLVGSLGAFASAAPEVSAAPSGLADLDPAQLKTELENAGVVVSYVGTETRNGVDSDHLTLTVDQSKLKSSPLASQLPSSQLGQLGDMVSGDTLSADVWLDRSDGRLNEADLHVASSDGSKTDVTILVSVPDSAAFDAPTDYTDVPIVPLITTLMQQFGGSLLPTP